MSDPRRLSQGALLIDGRNKWISLHTVESQSTWTRAARSSQPPVQRIGDNISISEDNSITNSAINHTAASDEGMKKLYCLTNGLSAISSAQHGERSEGSLAAFHDDIEKLAPSLSPHSLSSLIRQLSQLEDRFDREEGFPGHGIRWKQLGIRLCEILEASPDSTGQAFDSIQLALVCRSLPHLAPPRTPRLSRALLSASIFALESDDKEKQGQTLDKEKQGQQGLHGGQIASIACALADNNTHQLDHQASSQLHPLLLGSISEEAQNMSPDELCTALSSIARLDVRPDSQWCSIILPLVTTGLSSLHSFQIPRAAWFVIRLGMVQDVGDCIEWQESLLSSSKHLIMRMSGQDLSLLIWSLAKLATLHPSLPSPSPSWKRLLFIRSARVAPQSNFHSISMTLWAVTTLRLGPPSLWTQSICEDVGLHFSQGRNDAKTGQSLALTAWSIARLGHQPKAEWVHGLVESLIDNGQSLVTQDLANVSWAVARSGIQISSEIHQTLIDLFIKSARRELAKAAALSAFVKEEEEKVERARWNLNRSSSPYPKFVPPSVTLSLMLSASPKRSKSRQVQEDAASSVVSHLVTFLTSISKSSKSILSPSASPSEESPMHLLLSLFHELLPCARPQAIPAAASCILLGAKSYHWNAIFASQREKRSPSAPLPLPPIFRELLGHILLTSARIMDQIPPRGLVQLLWSLSSVNCPNPGMKWSQRFESSLLLHLDPLSQGSTLPPASIAITLWSLAKWGPASQVAQQWPRLLKSLVACSALTASRASPQDLAMMLWAISHLEIRPVSAHWWSAVLMATETNLLSKLRLKGGGDLKHNLPRKGSQRDYLSSMITVVWSVGKLRVRPPESWASSVLSALASSCPLMDAKELSLCLSGLVWSSRSTPSTSSAAQVSSDPSAAQVSSDKVMIGARVREVLVSAARGDDLGCKSLDEASLPTLLWSAARLGLPLGKRGREAALSCAKRIISASPSQLSASRPPSFKESSSGDGAAARSREGYRLRKGMKRLVLRSGNGSSREGKRLVMTIWALDKLGCSPSATWLDEVEMLTEMRWIELMKLPQLKYVLTGALGSMRRRLSPNSKVAIEP